MTSAVAPPSSASAGVSAPFSPSMALSPAPTRMPISTASRALPMTLALERERPAIMATRIGHVDAALDDPYSYPVRLRETGQ